MGIPKNHYAHLKKPYKKRKKIFAQSKVSFKQEDEHSKYLEGEELYIPSEIRGKGLAKEMVQAQEQYAKQQGVTRVRRTPGNRNGAVFWTMQGYDWKDTAPIPIQGDLMNLRGYIETGKVGPPLHYQNEFRFEKISANWENLKPHFGEFVEYAEKAENIQWRNSNDFFTAKDLLEIGRDKPFKDENGEITWAGKVFLTNAGSWEAWENL